MTAGAAAEDARRAFESGIGRRTGGEGRAASLPPPERVVARPAAGHVTVDWTAVPGAVGYLVHRAERPHGPFRPVDHGGNDVLAVPHPPYVDTSGVRGRDYWYAVAALSDVTQMGPLSAPVRAAATADRRDGAPVQVEVAADTVTGPLHRPWRPMIGSEHLSLLLSEDRVGGRPIGAELREALHRLHTDVGVQAVRAHAILGDDLGVYREVAGRPVHDFTGIDRVYDTLREIGLRPVVELSYMPRDLARDPAQTVFGYRAIISPPKDWDRWVALVTDLTVHLVERYGRDEVREQWSFEVWNEANLDVFWSGTREEYLRLYDVTAAAVRRVDDRLVVGGPGSAAAQWVDVLLEHAEGSGAAVDFVSTHTYGSPPLDLRPLLARHGRPDARIWWTEWGPGSQHFHHVGDTVFAATFLVTGMVSAMGRIDALSHWVASDHFEELGRPQALGHGGFGLLTVGNLRKPRYWALHLLERLGDERLAARVEGADAGLVDAVAARDGATVGVLLWNSSLDQSRIPGDPLLGRRVTVTVSGLPAGEVTVRHWRVDEEHSNVFATWRALGGAERDWPAEEEWKVLRAADGLTTYEPARTGTVGPDGRLVVAVDLPHPAISYLEVVPAVG